jgi:RHS repeat-associated protein
VLYYPYGETRYITGTLTTDYGYTGQRTEAGLGLMDYGARYYDPYLGRFVSADTIVPNPANPQSFNRFCYVLGNPVRYTDPTGHCAPDDKECNEMADYIEEQTDGLIHIDRCAGGEGCIYWTTEELRLAWKTYRAHPFRDGLSSAKSITLRRMDVYYLIGKNGQRVYMPNVAGLTEFDGKGNYTITMYDSAWQADPASNAPYDPRFGGMPSNFKGQVAHELMHVVTLEHPEIVESIGSEYSIYSDCGRKQCAVGREYAWSSLKDDRIWKHEMAAMTVAAYMYEYTPSRPVNPLGRDEIMWVGNKASTLRPPQSPSGPVRRGGLYVY